MHYSALVLAAGSSSRMGQFKPLLPLAGRPALARALESFHAAGPNIRQIIVVGGHRAQELAPICRAHAAEGVQLVCNPDPSQGMFSSIRIGVQEISPTSQAFFLLPVDIPLVRAATLQRLMRCFEQQGRWLIHPTFLGEPGHPPLIGQAMVPRILTHDGQGGLRTVLEEHADHAGLCPVADHAILQDMDRPEDYTKLANQAKADYPDEQECLALFQLAETPIPVQEHCRAVAQLAVRMAEAVNRQHAGHNLDLALVQSAALVHDVAKARPRHAEAGASLLEEHGFAAVAPLVRDHADLDMTTNAQITEREIVFLADKFVQGTNRVPLQERYLAKLTRFSANPVACEAVLRRLHRAEHVLDQFYSQSGQEGRLLLGD